MEELVRTKVSRFHIKDSLTLAQVQQRKDEGTLEDVLVPVDNMFADYEAVWLKEEFVPYIYNGNTFLPKHMKNRIELLDGKKVRVYDNQGQFVAIYKFIKEKYIFKIEKMFFERKNDAVH